VPPASTDTPELGPLLRRARLRQALTEQALADLLKTSRRTIIRWELGQALPSVEAIRNGDGAGPLPRALGIGWQRIAKARARDLERRRQHNLLDLPWPPVGIVLLTLAMYLLATCDAITDLL